MLSRATRGEKTHDAFPYKTIRTLSVHGKLNVFTQVVESPFSKVGDSGNRNI